MRQLVYISTVSPTAGPIDTATIIATSRRNNARVRVTGLLWFDGKRFLQALEGDEAVVDQTFTRIQRDPRHKALVVLSSRVIEAREFGDWSMALRMPGDADDGAAERVAALVANTAPEVRATFESFSRLRRAA